MQRTIRNLVLGLASIASLACSAPVLAGRACEEKPMTVNTLRQGLALAESTRQALEQGGAQVYVLARAGQDLRRFGLDWSHLGFAYAANAPTGNTAGNTAGGGAGERQWRVVHKLNDCGSDQAAVYRQGLAEFFNDGPWRHEALLLPLKPAAADKLLTVLANDRQAVTLHEPAYSVVAYPWSQKYQQSNQWAIETLAYAVSPGIRDRQRAQAWLLFNGYQPTVLNLGAFERLGARMTRANVAFDDHPNRKRFSDHIETVTVESVVHWLQSAGLAEPPTRIR